MNFFNILEENLPFIVIGLMVIVIFVLAYYTFIKPKAKNRVDEVKESKIDQAIINQDSDKLEQTNQATPNASSTEEDDEEDLDEEDEENEEDEEEDQEESPDLGKYHITYRQKDNKWIVTREGSDKTIRVLHTKKEAIAYATIKAINQDTNIVIHGRDGKIEKHGY
ncbi:MAG: DUF2188 domain-containing protein [Candidatus Izemoplasmatales bacterium]